MRPGIMKPLLASVGAFQVHSYGLLVSLAMVLGSAAWLERCRSRGISDRRAIPALIVAVLAGLAGAKLAHWLFHQSDYGPGFLSWWSFGYSSSGGFVAACAAAAWFLRGRRFALAADAAAVPMALSYALAKTGCLMAGCCYGEPSVSSWGVVFDLASPAGARFGATPLVPVQAYFVAAFLILGAALAVLERRVRAPGRLFWIFAASYFALRLPLDLLRADLPGQAHGFWAAPGMSSAALAALILVRALSYSGFVRSTGAV